MNKNKTPRYKTSLGRGLSSLINGSQSESDQEKLSNATDKQNVNGNSNYIEVNIDNIKLNPFQPRQEINSNDLNELVDSIKEKGIIVPLIVAKDKKEIGKFILIAGERRLKAAKIAGLSKLPVIIRDDVTNLDIAEIAIIENLHRKNLNPIEEGFAYLNLIKKFDLNPSDIAKKLGKSEVYIENKIRLTSLPPLVRNSIILGEITEGHGRALVSLNNEEAIIAAFKIVIRDNLSVRKTEELVREIKLQSREDNKFVSYHRTVEWLVNFNYIKEGLSKLIGKDIKLVKHKKSGGSLIINFNNDEELDAIYRRITRKE